MSRPSLEETLDLVVTKFEGINDSQGVPMSEHMKRVACSVPSEYSYITTALLHDLVEDTPVTFEDLEAWGYSPEVIEAVRLLTHDKKTHTYPEYIDRLCQSGNRIALVVKIHDQYDNTNPKRWLGMNQFQAQALSKKWAGVLPRLEEALRNAT